MNISKEIIEAHRFSSKNKQIMSDENMICGCFYCLEIFAVKDIKIWVDDDQTAMCPSCGIDSVICENSSYKIDKTFLKNLKTYWFSEKEFFSKND